jgi:hypothetical protein
MLIDKQTIVTTDDIVTVKLVSGEEIVGRLLEQGIDAYTLGKPVTVALQPINAQQMGMQFLPVLGSVEPDATLVIPKNAVAIRPVKTAPTIKSNYIELTTGLITPGTKTGLVI